MLAVALTSCSARLIVTELTADTLDSVNENIDEPPPHSFAQPDAFTAPVTSSDGQRFWLILWPIGPDENADTAPGWELDNIERYAGKALGAHGQESVASLVVVNGSLVGFVRFGREGMLAVSGSAGAANRAKTRRRADGTISSNLEQEAVGRRQQRHRLRRQRRGGRAVCPVAIDLDPGFIAAWGGNDGPPARRRAAAVAVAKALVIAADAVFSDPGNFEDALGFVPASAAAVSSNDTAMQTAAQAGDPEALIEWYRQYLGRRIDSSNGGRGSNKHIDGVSSLDPMPEFDEPFDPATAHDHRLVEPCLSLLFTHTAFTDDTMGATLLGALGTDGIAISGACATTSVLGGTAEPRNVAVLSSIRGGKLADFRAMLYTLVHELGHSFGARHNCCHGPLCAPGTGCAEMAGTDECNPVASAGSKFVMHPVLSAADASLRFSPCSKAAVRKFLNRSESSDCLVPLDPCRYGGPCCNGDQLRPSGTICSPASPLDPCLKPARCSGFSATCPPAQLKNEGALCQRTGGSSGLGVCQAGGKCVHRWDDYCALAGAGSTDSKGCTVSGHPCVRGCLGGVSKGECVPEPRGRCDLSKPETCSFAVPGTACVNLHGQAGLCSGSSGHCELLADVQNLTLAGLLAYHGSRHGACAWIASPWSSCSRDCGGGRKFRDFDCVCGGGAVDGSGHWCEGIQPPPASERCNTEPCPTCSMLEVSTTTGLSRVADVSGTFVLASQLVYDRPYFVRGGDISSAHGGSAGVPLYLYSKCGQFLASTEELYFWKANPIALCCTKGCSLLIDIYGYCMFTGTLAFGKSWWVFGPKLGSSYSWLASVISDSPRPMQIRGQWALQIQSSTIGVVNSLIAALDFRCVCNGKNIYDDVARACLPRRNTTRLHDDHSVDEPPESTSTPEPLEALRWRRQHDQNGWM